MTEADANQKIRKQERCERETIILYNDDSLADGFFEFGTSKKNDWRKFLKRVGGKQNLIDIKIEYDRNGNPVYYRAFVPSEMRSMFNFGIRTEKSLSRSRRKTKTVKNSA